ncbi:unnamed protein product [Porites lobata]|uniref:Pre-mRNA branch site protein p14 n=1 Tax=Porites lobata TaxID=104759 RepID=A0ABN8P575_9CNID|nr:unnamed protein product [Porites lobata]CAH3133415.1 unnamed protein product [Porites lobata]
MKNDENEAAYQMLRMTNLLPLMLGNAPETRGTAFVVYEDIFDAKNACDHLSGFNVCNRYLVVLYYQSTKDKAFQKLDKEKKRQELEKMKEKSGINKGK